MTKQLRTESSKNFGNEQGTGCDNIYGICFCKFLGFPGIGTPTKSLIDSTVSTVLEIWSVSET